MGRMSRALVPLIHDHCMHSIPRTTETCGLSSQRGLQMLKKGADNSENHRVRADFLESRDYASIEAKVTGKF